jgi:hypothetical protein
MNIATMLVRHGAAGDARTLGPLLFREPRYHLSYRHGREAGTRTPSAGSQSRSANPYATSRLPAGFLVPLTVFAGDSDGWVEMSGIEPLACCLQGSRSPN